MTAISTLSDDIFQQLIPINRLTQQQRALLLAQAELRACRRGTDLPAGAEDHAEVVYLIEGRVELRDPERGRVRIEAGSAAARLPLFPIRSPHASARAASAVTLAVCNRAWLEALLLPPLLLPYCRGEADADATDADWLQQLLRTLPFRRLPAPFLQQLFARAEPIACVAGQTVVGQAAYEDFFYVVQSGGCEAVQTDGHGRILHTLAELGPGDWFGEVPLLSGTPSSVTINMRRDGALLRVDRRSFFDLVHAPLVEAIDDETARARVETGARWLDVREPGEFEARHPPAAVNCRLDEILEDSAALETDRCYIIGCDSGARSAVAAWLSAARGYNVSWLCHATPPSGDAASAAPAQPDPLLAALRGELTRLLQQVDSAMRIRQEAETARREAERAARARLEEERTSLDDQARQVRDMLTHTQQLQRRLVQEKDRLYAGLQRREQAVKERIDNMNDFIEKRIAQERRRIEAHYRSREIEIQRLQQEKTAAESRLMALQEGNRTAPGQEAGTDTGSGAGTTPAPGRPSDRGGRGRHAETRDARSAIADQAQDLLAELGHAPARIQAARDRLLHEREQLESSAREINDRVEQTLLDKQATYAVQEALQHEAEQLQHGDAGDTAGDEALETVRAGVEAATERYHRAEQAHAAALTEKQKHAAALEDADKAEHRLVQDMNAEIEAWLEEEANRPRSPRQATLIRQYEDTMQRMEAEAAAAAEHERTHDHLLQSEINAALESEAAKRSGEDEGAD